MGRGPGLLLSYPFNRQLMAIGRRCLHFQPVVLIIVISIPNYQLDESESSLDLVGSQKCSTPLWDPCDNSKHLSWILFTFMVYSQISPEQKSGLTPSEVKYVMKVDETYNEGFESSSCGPHGRVPHFWGTQGQNWVGTRGPYPHGLEFLHQIRWDTHISELAHNQWIWCVDSSSSSSSSKKIFLFSYINLFFYPYCLGIIYFYQTPIYGAQVGPPLIKVAPFTLLFPRICQDA